MRVCVIEQMPVECRYTPMLRRLIGAQTSWELMGDGSMPTLPKESYNWFAGLEEAVAYESTAINKVFSQSKIDVLVIMDVSFPGLAAAAVPALKLKFPGLIVVGVVHAGAWCKGDIFSTDAMKLGLDTKVINYLDIVFVATSYHADLIMPLIGTKQTGQMVVLDGMPLDVEELRRYRGARKTNDILLVGRPEQSVVLREIGLSVYSWEVAYNLPREEYLQKLAASKICLSTKTEETFGYSAVEAAAVGTIPLVPDGLAYKETMPPLFRYQLGDDLLYRVAAFTSLDADAIERLCAAVDVDRYATVLQRMNEEIEKYYGDHHSTPPRR